MWHVKCLVQLGAKTVANWVKCTRKADEMVVYLNLDTVQHLRWNEIELFTVVSMPGGKENNIRILERPEDLVKTRARS